MRGLTAGICLLLVVHATAQYRGGINDGFHSASLANQNPLPNIYAGGSNDGASHFVSSNQNGLQSIYLGGNNDGYSIASISGQNPFFHIYTGGPNDGSDMISVSAQNSLFAIYLGGNNDGYHQISVFNQNTLVTIYYGGSNDGSSSHTIYSQNPLCTTDSIRWNGSVDTAWENPQNWDCKVLPNVNHHVIIPSGLIRYPFVSVSFEVRSIHLQPGSSVTVLPGINFKINGQ